MLGVLAGACRKSTRDRAKEYVDDTSLATPVALAKAAEVYYPKAKTWAEGADQNWRIFVVVERTSTPSIVKRGNETVVTFYEALDGSDIVNDGVLLGLGGRRGVGEVLVAERYHANVDGRDVKILQVRRTRPSGQAAQILSSWAPEDLEKAKPYDMLMNERSVVIPPP